MQAIINSPAFWTKLTLLCKILEPFTKVLMAIQADHALLGDIPRYWAYLARSLEEGLVPLLELPGKPREFAIHAAARFSRRSQEMDTPYLRLALLLDPRFKTAIDTSKHYFGEILRLVRAVPMLPFLWRLLRLLVFAIPTS